MIPFSVRVSMSVGEFWQAVVLVFFIGAVTGITVTGAYLTRTRRR